MWPWLVVYANQDGSRNTGHAEPMQVTSDPHKVSCAWPPQVYFSEADDPAQLDRQGPDAGTKYRSAIFPASAEQTWVEEVPDPVGRATLCGIRGWGSTA